MFYLACVVVELQHKQYFLLLTKSCKTYPGLMLPSGGSNGQLIDPN
jgi:hypothetical protein